jgi:hypothetical protein
MPHLISFTTKKFDAWKETPNPINPIAGESVLTWIRGELNKTGWDVSEPDAEDWGWYMIAQRSGASYLVGASGEVADDTPPNDWIVQIHKQRTFFEKLTGKNKMTDGDPLSREIEALARRSEEFKNVDVDKSA